MRSKHPCYITRIIAWLMITAAVTIFLTLHFRLYRCCQFGTVTASDAQTCIAFVAVVAVTSFRALRRYFSKRKTLHT